MNYCYILYSPQLNKFYIGSTSLLPDQRIELHLANVYGNKAFTSKTNDWQLFTSIPCDSKKQSILIEKHIKRMKSKTYIQNLVKYNDIIDKLKLKYK